MSRQDEVREMLRDATAKVLPHAPGREEEPELLTLEPEAPASIASVTLAVRDLETVRRFYRDVIGFGELGEAPGRVDLGVGQMVLLRLLHCPDARPDDPAEAGLFHTAFLLPSRADLGAWLRHVARSGQTLDGAADHLVSEAFYLHDPEGNGVEVYADRPRAQWQWESGQIVMANSNPDMAAILAAAPHTWGSAPPGTRIGHVHLRVGDVPAAVAFYTGALGLDVTRAGREAAFLSWSGYHHHIACNVWQSRGAGPRDPGRAGLVSVQLAGANAGSLQDPWGTAIETAA